MLPALLRKQRTGPLYITILHAAALLLFIRGFLLTRVRLDERNASAALPAPRTKLVWLMIDSLRYDFVVSDGRYSCSSGRLCHQGHMEYLINLTSQAQVARAFRFIADPPTTTTQRLKSLMTGGLPSFFDVSSSFSAGQLSEDNLIDQLVAAGNKLAFVGDTTWGQLFPTQFTTAVPFPCFNVKDLHTVDDGVWAHLLPMLRQPGSWDVLVAHYLGVDHAGHAHGVDSHEMVGKLRQMDGHIRQVIEEMVEGAGPGGEFEQALVLVSGDHGQTLSGDHGGGSPEEVDSALVAIDPSALHRLLRGSPGGGSAAGSGPAVDAEDPPAKAEQQGRELGSLWGPASCRRDCSCGLDGNQCACDLPQTDLTPTLAALLGVPIPYGNVGKVSVELWGLAAAASQLGGGTAVQGLAEPAAEGRGAPDSALGAVLRANVEQVHAYLNTYASTPGATFSNAALRDINLLYAALEPQGPEATNSRDTADQNSRYLVFLEAAAALAREQWTQFNAISMLAGLALFAATLCVNAVAAFGGQHPPPPSPASKTASSSSSGARSGGTLLHSIGAVLAGAGLIRWTAHGRWPVPTVVAALTTIVAVHVLGIFSFFFLLSEGSKLCYIVGAMAIMLTASPALQPRQPPLQGTHSPGFSDHPTSSQHWRTGISARQPLSRRPPMQALLLGLLLLGSNAAMATWGLANHSGLAFWHRLTVHTEAMQDSSGVLGQEAAAAGSRFWIWIFGGGPARLLSLPSAGGTSAWAAAGPIVLCVLPTACLAALAIHMLELFPPRQCSCATLRLQRWLLATAFASVAAYQALDVLVQRGLLQKDATAVQLLQQAHATTGILGVPAMAQSAWRNVAQAAVRLPQCSWQSVAVLSSSGVLLMGIPLCLLLPQLTYLLCGTSLVVWAAQHAQRRLQRQSATHAAAISSGSAPGDARTQLGRNSTNGIAAYSETASAELLGGMAAGAVGLQGPLLAAILQVSDSTMPLLMLLGAAQLWAMVQLLQLRGRQLGLGAPVGLEGAVVLAGVQAQAFFTTGHLCEFAGLQYLAGFVGFDEFHLVRSAVLLVIHTFGAMMLVALALPAMLCTLQTTQLAAAGPASKLPAVAQQPSRWLRAMPTFLLVRSCTAFAATLSAAVQRRHLYAWALFAPKFAFEACFLLGTDLIVSLVCLL